MKNIIFVAILFFAISCNTNTDSNTTKLDSGKNVYEYVKPLIGSDYHGHVFVGANMPFGAVQLGPNNINKGWDWCSGYHYSDSIVIGFSHTHLSGTGCSDLGDIMLMPTTGKLLINPGTQKNHKQGYASLYNHKNEHVEAGYYSVLLNRYNINVELTTTERVGIHRYKFPKSDSSRIIINLKEGNLDEAVKTYLKKQDGKTILGYRISNGWSVDQRVYFALQVSKPFDNFVIYDDSIKQKEQEFTAASLKGVLNFKTKKDENIIVKVGISPVSVKNALENIKAEAQDWDFDKYRANNKKQWVAELDKIKIKASKEISEVFYTALYHT